MPILSPIPHCVDDYSFTLSLKLVPFTKKYLTILEPLHLNTQFRISLSIYQKKKERHKERKKTCWDFNGDCLNV